MNKSVNLRDILELKGGEPPLREVCLIFLKEKDQLTEYKEDLSRGHTSQQTRHILGKGSGSQSY